MFKSWINTQSLLPIIGDLLRVSHLIWVTSGHRPLASYVPVHSIQNSYRICVFSHEEPFMPQALLQLDRFIASSLQSQSDRQRPSGYFFAAECRSYAYAYNTSWSHFPPNCGMNLWSFHCLCFGNVLGPSVLWLLWNRSGTPVIPLQL